MAYTPSLRSEKRKAFAFIFFEETPEYTLSILPILTCQKLEQLLCGCWL